MEKGRIRTISGYGSDGTLMDGQERVLNFSSSNIMGRDRNNVKAGDFIWFERIGSAGNATAINIRKC